MLFENTNQMSLNPCKVVRNKNRKVSQKKLCFLFFFQLQAFGRNSRELESGKILIKNRVKKIERKKKNSKLLETFTLRLKVRLDGGVKK